MHEMTWLESHIGSIEEGIELTNRFHWNLSVIQEDGCWLVKSGEKVLLRTDSRDSVEAFLYGMALAYSIVPDTVLENLKEEFQ